MAGLEAHVKMLIETVEKLVEKNIWLEGEILRSQEEILFLKKSKREMDIKLDDRVKELRALLSSNSFPSSPKDRIETASKEELEAIKGEVRDIQDEIKDLKNEVNGLRLAIPTEETKLLFRRLSGVNRKVMELKMDLTKGMEKLDRTDEKVERMSRVFNRLHAAGQAKIDLGEEVEGIRDELVQLTYTVIQIQQQQQNSQASPTLRPASPMTSKIVSTPLSHHELQEVRRKSVFAVMINSPCGTVQAHSSIRITGYTGAMKNNSIYMNMQAGIYRTPTSGHYKFGGKMKQLGDGVLQLYVCGEGMRQNELVAKTDKDEDFGVGTVYWECGEGVGVWLQVVRTKGKAKPCYFSFEGELM